MCFNHLEYWECLFMVKVNIHQLLTIAVLLFTINDKTLHWLFSFTHWEFNSGSSSDNIENCQI